MSVESSQLSTPRHVNIQGRASLKPLVLYDRWLLFAAICLAALGLLMVASSSIVIAKAQHQQAFYYLIRQVIYLSLGVFLALVTLRLDIHLWRKSGGLLVLLSMALLVLVLIPGIGRSVNGSMRWIGVGPFGLQVSELVKLTMIIYLAGYLVRHQVAVRERISGFIKPLLILAVITLLLLREPDFGSAVVVIATTLGLLFLAGIRIRYFLVLLLLTISVVGVLAVSSPYRLIRLTTFMDPWANPFDSGYQLTQSLIAFGRGGWFGVGLGESVQKLFYLPEAHTDFLFAVLAEELGFIGVIGVIGLFSLLVGRAFLIGRRALQHGMSFAGYMAYGFALWLGLQAAISMGVNTGILPTKGLTLPLMSYGGNSLLVTCVAIALLLRIDHEVRWKILGFSSNKTQNWDPNERGAW